MSQEKNQPGTAKLRVVESLQDDAYKGIARIDTETMKEIGVKRGDIVLIKGSKETVAIADRAYPADVGEGTIRIDGILRRNAKTGVGETVIIKKADIREAKKILIAPAQKGIMVQADSETLKSGLLGRAVVKGDIFVMGGTKRRRDIMSGGMMNPDDIFGDIMSELSQMGLGGNFGGFGGMQQIKFVVAKTSPDGPLIITENTDLQLSEQAIDISEDKILEVTYEDIGGLEDEVRKVRELVELPLRHPEIFEKLGIEPPKGILLYGPPGTGKTLIAKAVANETKANFVEFNNSDVVSALHGQTEKNIKKIFEDAEKNAPSIIFIDELDSIAFKREERGPNEFLNAPVMELLRHMDGLKGRRGVIVVGATNRPNSIDPALRRPGRFDREVEIGIPDKKGRLAILKIHTRNMPLDKSVDLDKIASVIHGFVGADISALVKESAMSVLRREIPKMNLKEDEKISDKDLNELKISSKDFDEALRFVKPSALREVLVETPEVKWDDVGGLDKVKQELKEAVEWPLKYPDSFTRMGIRPPRGLLLYGPPGTGKTLLAKAVARESEANFIQVKASSLLSMWAGESEKGVQRMFEKARQVSPCVIFFDEMDGIAGRRGLQGNSDLSDRVLNQLLSEMDGIEDNAGVIVIGATNRPDILDSAILRPGRFDRLLLVGPSEKKGRLEIFKIHTKNMPLAKDVNLNELAEGTEGCTGADIESICREAAMLSLREDIESRQVKLEHFEGAMKKVKPSITKTDMDKYKKIEEDYLRSARSALEKNTNYLG